MTASAWRPSRHACILPYMRLNTPRRAIAISCLISVASCTQSGSPNAFNDAPGNISLGRLRINQHSTVAAPTFWSSVSALEVNSARAYASTVSERFFTDALSALVNGDDVKAEVLFHTLLSDPDPLLRGRARIGMTVALDAQGKWQDLAALRSTNPPSSDSATANLTDRAAVDSWAGILRDVPAIEVEAPAAPETLPILGSSIGTPIIKVELNGRTHYFWLDTGASMSLLAANVAAECGVVPITGDTLAIAAAQSRIAARPAIANVVQIGNVTIRNLPVAVLDPSALRLDKRVANGRILTVKLDGVIGSDVLRRLSVVLDMGGGTISLARPAAHPPKTRTGERTLVWMGFPVVRLLTRDGRQVLFGLDTGADSTIVTDAWLDNAPDPELSIAKGSVGVLGAAHADDLPVLRLVVVGDGEYILRLHGVPIVQERRQTFVTLDGVLGADVLAHTTLHMDITNGIFAIRAPGFAPFPHDTGFVRIIR